MVLIEFPSYKFHFKNPFIIVYCRPILEPPKKTDYYHFSKHSHNKQFYLTTASHMLIIIQL